MNLKRLLQLDLVIICLVVINACDKRNAPFSPVLSTGGEGSPVKNIFVCIYVFSLYAFIY